MEKREFLKAGSLMVAATLVDPLFACTPSLKLTGIMPTDGVFTLPALGYAFTALEPHIDAMTMEIHHDRHHAAYVSKLNEAIKATPAWADQSLEAMMPKVTAADAAIRNHGGGHYNHSLFWTSIAPGGATAPAGTLRDALLAAFGTLDEFKKKFTAAATSVFGSGWAWLCADPSGKLFITTTPNQDNPLMTQLAKEPGKPILGLDVWEHAYYLKYQNKRADYINAYYAIINWDAAATRYNAK
ncbi:MAG: superoxide dismutase [Bacteroidia bacterium]|nr:superoxide dismutase [Bacteroidia bacterium]